MEAKGWFIVFGGLAIVVALIVGGVVLGGWIGWLLIGGGAIGAIAWLKFMAELLSAFNSDI